MPCTCRYVPYSAGVHTTPTYMYIVPMFPTMEGGTEVKSVKEGVCKREDLFITSKLRLVAVFSGIISL